MDFNGSELVSYQVDCLSHRVPMDSPMTARDELHPSTTEKGEGGLPSPVSWEVKNQVFKKWEPQDLTVYRYGVWSDIIQIV